MTGPLTGMVPLGGPERGTAVMSARSRPRSPLAARSAST